MYRTKIFRGLHCLAAAILLSASPLLASAQSTDLARQKADELFKAKKWPEAAQAYEAIIKAEPDNATAWYQLASARYSLEQFPLAAEAFQKNISLTKSPSAMFNLACVYARMNEKDKAIEWLGKTFSPETKTFYFYLLDLNDPDLASLHDDPRYKELWLSVDKKKNPCMYSAEARQFDFFVGEWDAFNPQGRKDGTSVIQRIANGCGILENWKSAIGGEGKSINFYDPQAGKWFEYWIGANGLPLRYSGIYKDGAIRYEGEPFTQNGKNIITRLTFFNVDANTVRQLAERSDDDGKSWTVNYDYKYVRRSPANNTSSNR
jgi:tetratricopeptide (TPR) repeat protein